MGLAADQAEHPRQSCRSCPEDSPRLPGVRDAKRLPRQISLRSRHRGLQILLSPLVADTAGYQWLAVALADEASWRKAAPQERAVKSLRRWRRTAGPMATPSRSIITASAWPAAPLTNLHFKSPGGSNPARLTVGWGQGRVTSGGSSQIALRLNSRLRGIRRLASDRSPTTRAACFTHPTCW